MAITTRQNRTLLAEDWTRVYQSFRNADFQSYDFETLRKSMIDYLRLNYPEDFNDYIESSEYVALIDLIAWLGQNLAFRADLNARENFIDTAERRDSVLKLAKLINYNPKRAQSASGLLKVDSVSTTESVFDSDGINLANVAINWNDPNNENWQDQLRTVINAALVNSQVVGKPGNTQSIVGVRTEEYGINLLSGQLPLVRFVDTVNDNNMAFEVVSATSVGEEYLYERPPLAGQIFNLLYRNDNLGNNSINTGFFLMFKQGQTDSFDFEINEALPNRVVDVDVDNINQADHWLYGLNTEGIENQFWTPVSSVSGVNVIYNNSINRNIYQINSKNNDQVSLVFGDGSFASVPKGRYRFYYRVCNGLTYKISSRELQNIVISLNYVSRTGRVETMTFRASLQYTVNNASTRETLTEIKQRAPQQYYTQNRMVSGEDYNIYPYTAFNNIVKVKAVNRTSSGISRFIDIIDPTGKYSRTNIFAADGVLYRNSQNKTLTFSYSTDLELETILRNTVFPLLSQPEVLHFYYENYPLTAVNGVFWKSISTGSNQNTGYFVNSTNTVLGIGQGFGSPMDKIRLGSLLEITAPLGKYFNAQNQLVNGTPVNSQERTVIYVAINSDNDGLGTGSGLLESGLGAVTVNNPLPDTAIVTGVIPSFGNDLTDLSLTIRQKINLQLDFGLSYDNNNGIWYIIDLIDLDTGDFDLTNQGSSNDSSWMILFQYNTGVYSVSYRALEYVFYSDRETNFYFDNQTRVFDSRTGKTLNDSITLLRINHDPSTGESYQNELIWDIYKNVIEVDGFQNPKKVLVTFADSDLDGVPDDPYMFDKIVRPEQATVKSLVFYRNFKGYDNFDDQELIDNSLVVTDFGTYDEIVAVKNNYLSGQLFYATAQDQFYELQIINNSRELISRNDLEEQVGRQSLFFQYQHNAPDSRRIDPSNTNIIDLYLLTKNYNTDYNAWIRDTTGRVPEPEFPTVDSLNQEFAQQLNEVKSISDTLILNPAKFKPLFGNKSEPSLRAIFKVVKNPNVSISDNEIKSSVVGAINGFFNIENWDFGESFYFSELSAYLHTTLSPNIASVIIVPSDSNSSFGDLLQVNAMSNEIIISSATVENIEIIPNVTAVQLGRVL
jgi:hypothetical protein